MCPILPEDIDVQWLRCLAREGRLYFDATEVNEKSLLKDRQRQVLNYVKVIASCASHAYEHYIDSIWKRIVCDERLNGQLFIKKGRNRGLLNRYRIMAIVEVLREQGVYDRDTYSLLTLHYRLEHVNKRTSTYTSYTNYAMGRNEITHLRKVVKDFL